MAKSRTATKARSRPASSKPAAPARKPVDGLDLKLAAAQRGVLCGVVVLAAVAVWRPMLDSFMLPKLTVIGLGAVLLLVLAGVRAVRLGRLVVPTGPAVWLALALALALVLATVTAEHPGIAIVGQHRRAAGLMAYLSYLVIFVVALRLYARSGARGLMRALLLALGLVVLYGLLQVAGLDPYTWSSDGLAQTFSTMGNINFASGYVGMLIPLVAAVVLLPGWSRAWRLGGLVLLLLSLVYLAANGSAQGPVAAAAGTSLVAAAWLLPRLRTRSGGGRGIPRMLVAAVGVVALLGMTAVAVRFSAEITSSLSERRYFWQAALAVFADHPLLGTGLESFRDFFTRYRAPEHAVFIGYDAADSPHNLPLEMLAAGGLPLAVAYLAFVGYTGWALVKALLAAAPDRLLVLAGFGGVWVGYQVQSLVSVDVPALGLLHFISAALVLAVAQPVRTSSVPLPVAPAARGAFLPRSGSRGRGLSAAGLVALLLLGLIGTWFAALPARADLTAGQARFAADAAERVELLNRAVSLAPWEAEYRLNQGRALIEAGDTRSAYDSAVAAAELRPGSSKLALGVADFAKKRGDAATGAAWIDEALRRDPSNPFLLEEVAGILRAEGDTSRADQLEQQAAALRAEHADF